MRGKHFSKAVFFTANEYNGFHQGQFPWKDKNNLISVWINRKYQN